MSDTITVDPAGLDSLIDSVANLEIPLRHDLALCVLLELRDARHEIHEYASEIIRQMREIAALKAENKRLSGALDAEKLSIRWGWLVYEVGEHTCGGYGPESGWVHEPGCGYEGIVRLDTLPGGARLAKENPDA